MTYRTGWTVIALLVLIGGAATPVNARLWVVSNSGVDGAQCGSYAEPCRTISQAIANAVDGDHIAVGPGQYGNVSGNPAFGGPGDERPGRMDLHGGFTGCVLCINKAVTITSFAGPAETVIQGNPKATQFPTVVGIEHDGVTFGTPGHGFTITGGQYGVGIAESCMVMTANVSVGGNLDTNDNVGFYFYGLDDHGLGTCATRTAQVWLLNNTAINNPWGGFVVYVNLFENQVILKKNLAMRGGIGFYIDPGSQNNDFNAYAGQVTLLNNVATNNDSGFTLNQFGRAQYNTAVNNTFAGFVLDGDPLQGPAFSVFSYNAAVGNRGPGVLVYPESLGGSGFADLSHNDFIGNDRDRTETVLIPGLLDIGPSAHCGLLNTGFSIWGGALAPSGGKLSSLHDYWGTPEGPKAAGPGDNAAGKCDKSGAVTTVVPFSTTPYVVNSLQ